MNIDKDIKMLNEIIESGWLISDFEKCTAIDACEDAIKALKQYGALQEIRQEIEECPSMDCGWGYSMSKNRIISIIDKHIKEIEDMGDYPDEIPNQFDNLTGSMNL